MPEVNDKRIDILLAEYRAVSQELTLYVAEMFRCVLYAGGLAALVVGIGLSTSTESAQTERYVPYAIVGLVMYFLTIATIRINLSGQRADLEAAINKEAGGDPLLTWESRVASILQRFGFVQRGWVILPTPPFLFGVAMIIAAYGLFTPSVDTPERTEMVVAISTCVVLTIYVFFIWPILAPWIRRKQQGAPTPKESAE